MVKHFGQGHGSLWLVQSPGPKNGSDETAHLADIDEGGRNVQEYVKKTEQYHQSGEWGGRKDNDRRWTDLLPTSYIEDMFGNDEEI